MLMSGDVKDNIHFVTSCKRYESKRQAFMIQLCI